MWDPRCIVLESQKDNAGSQMDILGSQVHDVASQMCDEGCHMHHV
jgi:hypothetical protein